MGRPLPLNAADTATERKFGRGGPISGPSRDLILEITRHEHPAVLVGGLLVVREVAAGDGPVSRERHPFPPLFRIVGSPCLRLVERDVEAIALRAALLRHLADLLALLHRLPNCRAPLDVEQRQAVAGVTLDLNPDR